MYFGVSVFFKGAFWVEISAKSVNESEPVPDALEKTDGHDGLGLMCINDQLSGWSLRQYPHISTIMPTN